MCGIAGIYQQNGQPVAAETVGAIGMQMTHRGPDNFSRFETERIGLAHNRLSLLDLSPAANQPFRNDNYVLAYNGEIYNFRQIRERLQREYNIHFQTTSDTEVLFYSLIYDGVYDCLRQIKGMFAFAFYDLKKEVLWLARDRLGIKPLYYFQRDGKFYWSSEIKALARTLDLKPDALKTVLSINGTGEKSNNQTLFKDVCPVKPGTCLRISSKNIEPQTISYYQPIEDFDEKVYHDLNRRSRREIAEEFERLLTESIGGMVVADAPLGSFVSGGIDSSLISAIAKKFYPDLKLFTANILGKHSEFADAETVAGYLDSELFDYAFEPEMMLRDWAETTYFYECPIVVHTNAIPFSNVAKLARDAKVKAVLTGEGADELFLGYPRLLAKRYESLALLPVDFVKAFYKIVPNLKDYLFPNPQATNLDFINQLVQNFELPQAMQGSEERFGFLGKNKSREQLLTIKMLNEHLVTLLYRNDRMGMQASIEARFPFLDEDLVKFAINLPSKFKIGRSTRWHNYKHPFLIDKWVIRKTAEKFLPASIVNKRKNGFPMSGHKSVKINKGFFRNGWIAEALSLNAKTEEFLLATQNPYFVAKLASVEIFGRLYAMNESIETVKDHVLEFAEMIDS